MYISGSPRQPQRYIHPFVSEATASSTRRRRVEIALASKFRGRKNRHAAVFFIQNGPCPSASIFVRSKQ